MAAYLIGYTSGFIAEQVVVTYITGGVMAALKAGKIGAKIGSLIRRASKGIVEPLGEALAHVRKHAMMAKNSIFRTFSQDALSDEDVRKLKNLLEQLQVDCCPGN